MEADDAITIYTTDNLTEAELIRNRLRDEGIKAEVAGEAQGGFSGVLDEIQIFVKAIDADRARAVIAELQADHLEEDEDVSEAGGPAE